MLSGTCAYSACSHVCVRHLSGRQTLALAVPNFFGSGLSGDDERLFDIVSCNSLLAVAIKRAQKREQETWFSKYFAVQAATRN